MSSIVVSLPKDYALVAAAAIGTGILNLWQSGVVGSHRKKSGVEYPNAYADAALAKDNRAAHIFNCAQRAHMNTLEHLPSVLVALMWTGLRYPLTSTALCATWMLGRILYTMGYVSGNPKSRYRGGFHTIAELGLYLTGLYAAYEMYTGKW